MHLPAPTFVWPTWRHTRASGAKIFKAFAPARPLRQVIAANLVLVASAWIAINIGPVPVTLQSLAVVMLPFVFGRHIAVAGLLTYLAQGAVGWPVLAQGAGGLHCLWGPTGGYLAGFVGAAFVTGRLAQLWGQSVWAVAASMLAGHAVILAMGTAWLSVLLGWPHAIQFGMKPFAGDVIVKVLVGTMLVAGMQKKNRDAPKH